MEYIGLIRDEGTYPSLFRGGIIAMAEWNAGIVAIDENGAFKTRRIRQQRTVVKRKIDTITWLLELLE